LVLPRHQSPTARRRFDPVLRFAAVLVPCVLAACGGAPRAPEIAAPAPVPMLGPPAPPPAPPTPPAEPDLAKLSRADCLTMALRGNRNFLIKHSSMERARYGKTIAKSQVYAPLLNAQYVMTNQRDSGTGALNVTEPVLGFAVQPFLTSGWAQDGDPATGRDQYTTSYGITVSRRIFAIAEHIRQRLPLSQADHDFYTAANAVVIEGKQLQLATTQAFYAIQRAQAHARVREHRVEDAREFLQVVKDSVAHGFKAPVEELNARIDLNQAEADLVNDRGSVQDAVESLARQLALPVTTPLGIVPEDLSGAPPAQPDLDTDLRSMRGHHEDLGNRIADIDLQADQLRVQRDLLAPQITAAATAQRNLTGHAPFDGVILDDNVYSLTFTWSQPFDFDAGAWARLRQIQDEIHEKTLSLRDAEDDLERQLRDAWRHRAQLAATVSLAEQRLAAEQGKMAATMSRWKSGAIDNLEVTRAKQELDTAEISLLDARIDLATAIESYRAILPAPTTIDGRVWNETGAPPPHPPEEAPEPRPLAPGVARP
jgi:outer membrane protein TolC